MNVSLTPQLEQLIDRKIQTGMYASVSEVVRAALRLLDEKEREQEIRLLELRAEVSRGVAQLEAGQSEAFTAATVKELAARGKRRLKKRR